MKQPSGLCLDAERLWRDGLQPELRPHFLTAQPRKEGQAALDIGAQMVARLIELVVRRRAAECAPSTGDLGMRSGSCHFRPCKSARRRLKDHAMKIVGVIPARYASTRFPGKPLALIGGKPLVQRVVERCRLARMLSEVIVATDDDRIRDVARRFCRVEMTSPDHPSGSDRIAEVSRRLECDGVVNIQGDEPLIEPGVIDAVAAALDRAEMSTAATLIRNAEEYDNPNVVKVVVSAAGLALYFSRRTIPYLREAASRSVSEQLAAFAFLKHLGIYGYRRETLLRLVGFPVSPLEAAEKLEQLRALENGIPIAVVRVAHDSVGVDVPADVARVEKLLAI